MASLIGGIDFENLEAEKFWSFPKAYKGNPKEETKNMVLSGEYLCSLKNDGHYFRFIKDDGGNMRLQGRTKGVSGEYIDKLDHVPHLMPFFNSLPNGTCLIGEIYFPSKRGSRNVTTIMGCLTDKAITRQEKGEKLHYYIFDVYAWAGKSLLETAYETRIKKYLNAIEINSEYVEKAITYEGQEAWDKLEEYLSKGLEGMVAVRKNAKVEPGKRTARKTLKIKTSLEETIDAFYDGHYREATKLYSGQEPENWMYWINSKTGERKNACMYPEYSRGEAWEPVTKAYFYGWASAISFSVLKDGKSFHIGFISGITEEVRKGVVENPDEWIGRVGVLSAMEIERIDGGFSLRHGRLLEWRDDKTAADCLYSQIE